MHENKDTISREAAKNALCQLCRDISNWRMCERNNECNLICRIDGVPAADVRPVVLCKDCMLRQYCKVAQYLGADGFCSNGEKAN